MTTEMGYSFGPASGPSSKDCYFLGYRFDAAGGFTPERSESFVLEARGTTLHLGLTQRAWMTSLWRSPEGRVFVCDALGRVFDFVKPAAGATSYRTHELGGLLSGVWGLDENFVWAWGMRAGEPTLYRWDGASWRSERAPGTVVAIHGTRPDLCVAVGEGGLIARWNGQDWARMESPSTSTLSGVFVESEDEIYACGPRGDLLTGSIYGWTKALTHEAGIADVAKWNGAVWVGAGGALGVSKLEGNALISVKANHLGCRFDARGELLAASTEFVSSSADGAKFLGWKTASLERMVAERPPAW